MAHSCGRRWHQSHRRWQADRGGAHGVVMVVGGTVLRTWTLCTRCGEWQMKYRKLALCDQCFRDRIAAHPLSGHEPSEAASVAVAGDDPETTSAIVASCAAPAADEAVEVASTPEVVDAFHGDARAASRATQHLLLDCERQLQAAMETCSWARSMLHQTEDDLQDAISRVRDLRIQLHPTLATEFEAIA